MHILYLTPRFPLPAIKGDKLRAWQFIRLLSRKHRVTLLSFIEMPEEEARRAEVEAACGRVITVPFRPVPRGAGLFRALAVRRPFQAALFESRAMRRQVRALLPEVDAVHCNTLRITGNLPAELDKPLVVDFIDALSHTYRKAADNAPFPLAKALSGEHRRLRTWERDLTQRAALSMAVSEEDARALGDEVAVVRHCVDTDEYSPARAALAHGSSEAGGAPSSRDIVFTGNLAYGPNTEAAMYLAREVFPLVRAQCPEARLRIVGANPRASVKALASDHIIITGFVPSIVDELRNAAVAAAPVFSGSGVKTKVLEAMACAAPVVATTAANAGIEAVDGEHLLIADTPGLMAEQIVRILRDPELASRLAVNGRQLAESTFSWDAVGERLLSLYDALPGRPAREQSAAALESSREQDRQQ